MLGLLRLSECVLLLSVILSMAISSILTWNEDFIAPYLEVLKWHNEEGEKKEYRGDEESTYYERYCREWDVSSYNASDLFVRPEDESCKAYDTFLEHGFAVFEDVIPKPIASELRDHIIAENLRVDPMGYEWNLLHGSYRRWNADALHPSDHQSISDAMHSVAHHNPVLVETLERVLGPNPAIVEMNAITSAAGAEGQRWHRDGSASLIQNARSFAPTHVLLMQLQDTTLEMGPTQVCPGTQMCTPDDDMMDYCNESAVHVVNSSGVLSGGSAVLMNTNGLHRGSAYEWREDLSEEDNFALPQRVMWVVTLAPRLQARAESRQIMHGLSFSMHWSLFGYTTQDFGSITYGVRDIVTNMIGWRGGYSFPGLLLHRVANYDYDGSLKPMSYKAFIEQGGVWWWPSFLMGDVGYDPGDYADEEYDDYELNSYWTDFFLATAKLCLRFVRRVTCTLATVYVLQLVSSFGNDSSRLQRQVRGSVYRFIGISGFFWLLTEEVLHHGRGTGMMRDLKAGMLAQPYFPNREGLYSGRCALPDEADLLVESRLGSEYLYMYNDQIEWHPGNRYWKEMVSDYRPLYQSLPPALRLDVAELMLDTFQHIVEMPGNGDNINDGESVTGSDDATCIRHRVSRILYQSPSSGDWLRLSHTDAVSYADQELRITPGLAFLARQLRFVDSECVYGFRSETALCQRHSSNLSRFVPKWLRVEVSGQHPKDGKELGKTQHTRNLWPARLSFPETPASFSLLKPFGSMQRNWRPACETTTDKEYLYGDDPRYTPAMSLVEGDRALMLLEHLHFQVTIVHVDKQGRFAYRVETGHAGYTYGSGLIPFTPLQLGQWVQLSNSDGANYVLERIEDGGEVCSLDDGREMRCASLARVEESKIRQPGASVLGYFQDSENETDFGWYEATVLFQHTEQPLYVEIEWYDGTRGTLHIRMLKVFTAIQPSDLVGFSSSGKVGKVFHVGRNGLCAVRSLEDDSGAVHKVSCSELRRRPYEPRMDMDRYNELMQIAVPPSLHNATNSSKAVNGTRPSMQQQSQGTHRNQRYQQESGP